MCKVSVQMEPALDVIDRSLRGDTGARSFLERTSSIYVLDVTNASSPKTYGCWNFIHQALNEVERFEARAQHSAAAPGNVERVEGLTPHVRLLASMALRVARRSPTSERAIVSTCIDNAAEYHCSADQSQWLIDLNLELREIVMGRIAAMALDFSFHRRAGHCAHSSFADKIVLDSFCAVLSANAVSTGPQAIKHFATEWIIPSSKNIPVPALVAVVRHLALEGQRLSSPVGTKDILQQLSMQIMSICVLPILSDAVSDNASQTDTTLSLHDENARIAATALQALKAWFDATDLSLPQLKHICSKVNLDVLEVLSNAMYSDSRDVIDALAEFIETSCQGAGREAISEGRMNQVRHIIQVDETAFQANFTADQLETIETKEMSAVVEELIFAIGLQRGRFTTRQEAGDHDVCRNLARIASTVTTSYVKTTVGGQPQRTERGLVDMLFKVAAHPRVCVASIGIETIPLVLHPSNSIVREALPVLQRRAIIPHEVTGNRVELQTECFSDISFEDFRDFREHVLTDALVSCWKTDGQGFFDSCSSAVEEFCAEGSTVSVSLFLEAAIFCIEAVGDTVTSSHQPFAQTEQLKRCTQALASRPNSLLASPLTLSRMANMLQKYATWYRDEAGLHTAADLVSVVFETATNVEGFAGHDEGDEDIDPLTTSCSAMQGVLSVSPKFFIEESKMASLGEMWKSCHVGGGRQCALGAEARTLLGVGLCQVLACLADAARLKGFGDLLSLPQDELEKQSQLADEARDEETRKKCLAKVAGEIRLIGSLCRSLTNTGTAYDGSMESGCPSSPDRRELVPAPVMTIVRRSWPKIAQLASSYSYDENISSALCTLLVDLLPPSVRDDYSLSLLRDLGAVASSMIASGIASHELFGSLCKFLGEFITAHGESIDKGATSMLQASQGFPAEREIFRLAEGLFLSAIEYARPALGEEWTRPAEQKKGQPPFESRDASTRKLSESTKDCLAALLPLLQSCLDLSPVFLSYLPARPGVDREQDMLLRRAVDSTVGALNEADSDLTMSAISLLETMLKQQSSQHEEIRSLISNEISRVSADTLHRLVLGSCGNYELTVVDKVASYLHTLLRTSPSTDVEQHMAAAFRQEHFALGEEAMRVAMGVFARCARRYVGQDELKTFLEEIWTIHRAEDRNALPQSDVVARLIRRYRITS